MEAHVVDPEHAPGHRADAPSASGHDTESRAVRSPGRGPAAARLQQARLAAVGGVSNRAIARLAELQRDPAAKPAPVPDPKLDANLKGVLKDHGAATVVDAIKDIVWVNPNQGGKGGEDLVKLWGSWGEALPDAAAAHLDIWGSSARKYPTYIVQLPQVPKAREAFRQQTMAKAHANLDANEKLIRTELTKFGLEENTDPNNPLLGKINNFVRPEVKENLEEVKRLAQVVKTQEQVQAELRKGMVTWDFVHFDPNSEPPANKQLPLLNAPGENLTLWKAMKDRWDKSQSLMGLVLNSNPAVFLAHGNPDAMDRLIKGNPKEEPAEMLADLHKKFVRVLKNVDRARDGLDDIDYRELHAIHDVLRGGPFKHKFSQWIIDDAVSDYEDTQYWTKLGLEAAAFTALIVAELATFGGATFFIASGIGLGVAAYQAAEANTKANAMNAMGGSVARADLQLVYRGQITAAEAEAEQANLNLVLTAGGIAFGAASRVGEAEQIAATKARLEAMRKRFAQEIAEDRKLQQQIDALDKVLNGPANAKQAEEELAKVQSLLPRSGAHAPSYTVVMPGSATQQEFEWGMARSQRLPQVESLGNARLASEGVPPAGAVELMGGPNNLGVFNMQSWEIGVSKRLLDADKLSFEEYAKLMDTINHEARHAKQYWEIARLKAGQPGGAKWLAEAGFPDKVIQKAMSNKLMSSDPQAKYAMEMFETFFGTGAPNRNKLLAETLPNAEKALTGAQGELDQALNRLRTASTSGNPTEYRDAYDACNKAVSKQRSARFDYDMAFLQYQKLPEEIDARVVAEMQTSPSMKAAARTGRPDVVAARREVDLLKQRVSVAQEHLSQLKALGSSEKAVVEADAMRALAEDDLATATTHMNELLTK